MGTVKSYKLSTPLHSMRTLYHEHVTDRGLEEVLCVVVEEVEGGGHGQRDDHGPEQVLLIRTVRLRNVLPPVKTRLNMNTVMSH